MRYIWQLAVGSAILLAGAAGSAMAEDLVSFSYSDLDGVFDGSSLFSAADDSDTDGELTRLITPTGDAVFAGTVADGGFPMLASFSLLMTVSNITATGAEVLPGFGSMTLTDIQQDLFTAGVHGFWTKVGSSANFIGVLSNVVAVNSSGDGEFNGDDGSGFGMLDLAAGGPYDGSMITLVFSNWFSDEAGEPQPFDAADTLTIGGIVPEPATLSLLAAGGLFLLRRRRR